MVKPYCGPKTKGLLGLEFKDRGGVVCFTGAQYGAWKFILVGRVREVLGFKAESVAVIIRFAFSRALLLESFHNRIGRLAQLC